MLRHLLHPHRLTPLVCGAVGAVLATVLLASPGTPASPRGASQATLTSGSTVTEGAARTAVASAKRSGNIVTPGDFEGYGFDQCVAPTQSAMNRWLQYSPFLSVGIYVSGDSRACRDQPNLSPTWISNQLKKGWRLLPIALGPQASCQPRFPRYSDDFKISPKKDAAGTYAEARTMGYNEANKNVADAAAYGIAPGSTLWYDLEGYDSKNVACRESALSFLSTWTDQVRALGYKAGVYSSAGSGIADLDQARLTRPGTYSMPDAIWVARWDGIANTSTSYIAEDGWRPGNRVKQYQGGHNETWGGVTINIDRNYLDVGAGSVAGTENRCGGAKVSFKSYAAVYAGGKKDPLQVTALQCLLSEKGFYDGGLTGKFNPKTKRAVAAWQTSLGRPAAGRVTKSDWVALLSAGSKPVLKVGSAGNDVRRLQRALNAASGTSQIGVTGKYNKKTVAAVTAWQKRNGVDATGIAGNKTWKGLFKGQR